MPAGTVSQEAKLWVRQMADGRQKNWKAGIEIECKKLFLAELAESKKPQALLAGKKKSPCPLCLERSGR